MRKTALVVAAVVVGVILGIASRNADAAAEQTITTAYLTGYSFFDNTPPGSATIAFPNAQHKVAGGTGTYANPITLAVGWSLVGGKEVPDYEPGTMFYLPFLHKYVRVEDECGDITKKKPLPQDGPCHRLDTPGNHADTGATVWLDVWVDGKGYSRKTSDNCMSTISKIQTVILNPKSTYTVHKGSITGACKAKTFYAVTK